MARSFSAVVQAAREFMAQEGLPGWLIYDYRQSNPIFQQVMGAVGHITRPCFLYIPPAGPCRLLTHFVDAGKFAAAAQADPAAGAAAAPGLELLVYSSRQSLLDYLTPLLAGLDQVAMEYSPQNALPRVSRVDAGTVELVRSLGPAVVSSADLMQYATQRWTPAQLAGQQRAAAKLGEIVQQAFRRIGARLGDNPTEYEIAEFIRRRFREENLETADGPIVAVNAHCSDPHYEPAAEGSSVIGAGDWVLIDLWARENGGASVYADITWTAYVGEKVPPRQQEIFAIVTGARDAALQFLKDSHQAGLAVQGWQADAAARDYIAERGYGDYFTHRLGHSIGTEVHGEAVNLDGFETHDTRRIIPGVGFSIEPGIYLPDFGVRAEIDAYMAESGPYATSPVQGEVVLIAADNAN